MKDPRRAALQMLARHATTRELVQQLLEAMVPEKLKKMAGRQILEDLGEMVDMRLEGTERAAFRAAWHDYRMGIGYTKLQQLCRQLMVLHP